MVVVDSHVAFWWVSTPEKLGPTARKALDAAERIGLPAIVAWELALLTRRRRLDLGMPVREWVTRVLSLSRVHELPLSAAIALEADALAMHPDPADRFIVATARNAGAPLVTKDRLIRRLKLVETIW